MPKIVKTRLISPREKGEPTPITATLGECVDPECDWAICRVAKGLKPFNHDFNEARRKTRMEERKLTEQMVRRIRQLNKARRWPALERWLFEEMDR